VEKEPTSILCDNNLTIAMSKNHVFHRKIKLIDTRCHFIHKLINNGEMFVQFCGYIDQLVDTLSNDWVELFFVFRDKT
jgi:hypothetical protein